MRKNYRSSLNIFRNTIQSLTTSILLWLLALSSSSCGEVADLGDQAGIVSEPKPMVFLSETLLPVTPEVPYRESVSASGGAPPLSYAIRSGQLPDGLVLDASSGLISGTVERRLVDQSFDFVVRATDALDGFVENPFKIVISRYTVSIFPEILPTIIPAQAYEMTLTIANAAVPVSFTTSGSLPPGLILETNSETATARIVSTGDGVPRESSNLEQKFGIVVTDANGMVAQREYTVLVGEAPIIQPLAIATDVIQTPAAGRIYAQVLAAEGGLPPYEYKLLAGSLLPGLELQSNGVIAGSVPLASAGATFAFTAQVKDALGTTAEKSFSGKASSYSFEIVPDELASATPTFPYSVRVYTVGAIAPVRYSLDGNLPPGLRLDVVNNEAVISDTGSGVSSAVANSTQSFGIVATDANDVTSVRQFELTVQSAPTVDPLVITTTSIPTPAAGSNYAAVLKSTGGIAPYVYSVQSGNLPSGLSLGADGVISGVLPQSAAGTSFSVSIRVTDDLGSFALQSFSGTVSSYTFAVVPDLLPPVTPQQPYTARIYTVGAASPVQYSISGNFPTGLAMTVSSSVATISDENGGVSPALQNTVRTFEIIARDANNIVQTAEFDLTIGAALVTPLLAINTSSLHAPIAGDNYIASLNVSGGAPPYTFSVIAGALPTGLSLNASTGFITGIPAFGTSGTPYVYSIRVTDSAAQTAERTYSGTVGTYALALQPASLPNAFPEAPYSASYSASTGNSPYSYRIFSGSLPPGLNINAVTGVVSGTVEAAAAGQSYNFTVEALDASNTFIRRADSITVNNYTTTISAPVNPTGNEGVAFSALMTAGGGVSPYTFEYQGTLPQGLGITNTGAFFGTPAASTGSIAGTNYLIYVRARDSRGYPSAFTPVTVTIGVTSVSLSAGTPPAGVRGAQYSHSLQASGGRGPYTYSLAATSAQLPDGLSLSSGGVISGTPVETSSCPAAPPVLVIAVDSLSQVSSSVTVCIRVDNGVVVTTTSLPPIIRSQSYNHTLTVTGGSSPYAVTGYGFPLGLTVNSLGLISGITSSSDDDAELYFTVQDSSTPNKLSGSKSFVVPIVDAVTLTSSTLASGAAGRSYSQTLLSSGGLAPRTFAITDGSLPPGLSISSSGVISGTIDPIAAVSSPYSFKVRVTDTLGLTSSEVSFTIPVSVPPRFTATTLTPARNGQKYSATVEFEGGVPPFNFEFPTPADVPAGLSIGVNSGIVTSSLVTASQGSYSFVIRVTDSQGAVTNQVHNMQVIDTAAPVQRPKIAAPSYSDICPTPLGGIACGSWHPYRVGQLVHSGGFSNSAFAVYFVGSALTNSLNNALVIARMDDTGRIGSLGTVGSTTVTNATLQIPIGEFVGDLEIGDMDNDGLNDIVVTQYSNNRIRIFWNEGESSGMPQFSMASSTFFDLPAGRVRPRSIHLVKLRTQNPSGLDVTVISDTNLTDVTLNDGTNDARINVFLSNCTSGTNCSASRSTILGAGVAYSTTVNAVMLAAPSKLVSGNFFGASNSACPSLATVGRRRNNNEHWAFILRQNNSGTDCLGTFTTAPNVWDYARYLVSENPVSRTGDLVAADFNGDGIDDIATVNDMQANVRIYYMQSNGNGWASAYNTGAVVTPNFTVPISVGGTALLVNRIATMCLNGSASCSSPSLLITGGRTAGGPQTSGGAVSGFLAGVTQGYVGIVPNTGGSFDTNGLDVLYYAAPPGLLTSPQLFPVVGTSPTLRDVVLLGTSTDTLRGLTTNAAMGVPYLMTFARNGTSTVDPFKANAFNNGTTTTRRVALRSYPDEFFYNEDAGTVIVRDFDGDGRTDIASHLVNAASVALSRGVGGARTTFAQADNFPVGVQHGIPMNLSPQTMDEGDFNNDGRPDLAVAGWTSRAIGILRTLTDGSVFSATPDVYTAGAGDSRPLAIKTFDADGDGKLDVIFSKLRFNFPSTGVNTASVSMLRGKGDGTFFDAVDLASGLDTGCTSEYIRKLETVDLDADGRPEIFVMCRGASASISILRRHTDGTWKKNNGGAPITSPSGLGMDFVVGQFAPGGECSYGKTHCVDVALSVNLIGATPNNTIRLLRRVTMDNPSASGAFSVQAMSSSSIDIFSQAGSMATGDFNMDGRLDLGASLITHGGGGRDAVIAVPVGAFALDTVNGFAGMIIEGDGLGDFGRQSMFGGQNAGMSNIATGHLNNTVDSILDFVLSHRAHGSLTGRGRLPDNAAIFNYLGEN